MALQPLRRRVDNIQQGRRNVFINGNMEIRQRGDTGTYTSGIWKYLSTDRWMGHFDSTPTGATQRNISGGPNSLSNRHAELRGPSSGGNGNCYFGQRVESSNLASIRYHNVMTLSGYIKRSGSNSNSTASFNIICPTATDNYASYTTHGSTFDNDGSTIDQDGTINSSGNLVLTTVDRWYYFTARKTNPVGLTNFDKGMQFYFGLQGLSSTSDKYQFAQLQLEAGRHATPFELVSVDETMEQCQRYYSEFMASAQEWIYFEGATANHKWWFSDVPKKMRATPTVTNDGGFTGGGAGGTVSSISTQSIRDSRVSWRVAFSSAHGDSYQTRHVDCFDGNKIYYDAEL